MGIVDKETEKYYNFLQGLYCEGFVMRTEDLEYGTIKAAVANRDKSKQITFFARNADEAKQKAMEWMIGQMLLSSDDFKEVAMFLANRTRLKREVNGL